MLGGDNRATSEITKLISQLPPAVQAITGVDLTGVLTNIPGASASAQWRGQKRSWSRFLSDCPRWKVKYRSFCFQYLIISISSIVRRRQCVSTNVHSYAMELGLNYIVFYLHYCIPGSWFLSEFTLIHYWETVCALNQQILYKPPKYVRCRASKSSIPVFIPVHPVTKLWKNGYFQQTPFTSNNYYTGIELIGGVAWNFEFMHRIFQPWTIYMHARTFAFGFLPPFLYCLLSAQKVAAIYL